MVLTGFRFSPTDEEVIEILSQKVSGNTSMAAFDFIIQKNIYDFEPQELHGSESTIGLNKNERYYYCRRESDSREVMGRGWWKATSHVKAVSSPNGEVMGYKRPLTFHRFKDNIQGNRKGAIKTDWIMHEYGLQSIHTEWRLCKIKYKGKEKVEEDMTPMEKTFGHSNNKTLLTSFEAKDGSSSSSNSIAPMQLELAFEQPPLTQPILPVNNDINYNYDSYCWSNSNMMLYEDHQLADQLDTLSEQPFSDLWSWDDYH
ncbi:NAC domain-containing protein 30 [Gossypium raimondii]|uniref:NAC domain-containing protein n=2 Tax=Gossypium TaxID=3633 RepID=A0A0D2S9P5_GOSRA|nr:NAC domain-containing protein 30 [Gossypium raimondii]KJB27940.1 hypothetical protein B456_005G020600 [Gossypium raimondii]